MSKKLLLSTILSSALLASTTANAAIREFSFDGGNQFTFEGNQYTGLDALGTFILTSGTFNPAIDDLKMTDLSQRAFLDALKVDGGAERAGFTAIIAARTGENLAETKAVVDKAIALVSDIETNLY